MMYLVPTCLQQQSSYEALKKVNASYFNTVSPD